MLRDFELFCRTKHIGRVSQLTMQRAQEFLQWRDAYAPQAPKTKHSAISILRAWLNACVDAGLLESSPIRRWLMPKVPEPSPRALSEAELKAVLAHIKKRDEELYPIVLFMARTGFRPSDAIDLRWGQIAEDRISRVQRKTQTQIDFPISQGVAEALELAKPETKPSSPVFSRKDGTPCSDRTLLRRFKRVTKALECSQTLNLKLLRTTFSTHLARKGCHPKVHQRLLGHSDLSTTLRYYTEVDYDMARVFLNSLDEE